MANENENQPEVNQEEDQPTMFGGLKNIGFAILFFGIAYYFYITMTSYENGEEVTMNSILILAYEAVGKSVTSGILGLIGLFFGFSGVKEIIAAQKS